MKYWVTVSLVLLAFVSVKGQESIFTEINYPYLERLIQLAKENNYRKKVFEATEAGARAGISAARTDYLNMLHASYFYRPKNRPSVNVYNPYQVNGFQLGVSLNLATLVRTPILVKQAKQQHEISELERQEYEVTLEKEVKSRYYAYVLLNNQLEIGTQEVQDYQLMLNTVQEQFEMGEVDLATYNTAKSTLAQSRSNLNQTEVDFLMAKDALEEIIGTKLEDIIE